jgi:hypothetical protein
MNRARPLLLRDPERLPHDCRNGRRAYDLIRHLGQRRHGRNNVDHLKARLLAAQNARLPRDHHHRHGAEQRVSRTGCQVERAGAEGGDADSWLAGQPPMSRRHESRRLLMAGQHQLDFGAAQRFDHVEVFLARHPEDLLHALALERGDNEFGAVHQTRSSTRNPSAGSRIPAASATAFAATSSAWRAGAPAIELGSIRGWTQRGIHVARTALDSAIVPRSADLAKRRYDRLTLCD